MFYDLESLEPSAAFLGSATGRAVTQVCLKPSVLVTGPAYVFRAKRTKYTRARITTPPNLDLVIRIGRTVIIDTGTYMTTA